VSSTFEQPGRALLAYFVTEDVDTLLRLSVLMWDLAVKIHTHIAAHVLRRRIKAKGNSQ
jgi:hypothetical protein